VLGLLLLGHSAQGATGPCGPEEPVPGTEKVAYLDAVGRRVDLPVEPRRIVSLAPSLTEILFAVGAGEQVVGVTTYCDWPTEAAQRAKVGGFTTASPEAVVALKPDFILATSDTSTRKRFDALVAARQPVFVVHPNSLESTRDTVACVARIVGRSAAGQRVVDEMLRGEAAVRQAVKGRRRPRVVVLLQSDPLIAAGANTFLDELIQVAGGQNLAAGAPVSWPRLSREQLLLKNPEVVFVTAPGGLGAAKKLLMDTAAGKDGRIYAMDPDLIERPGPRIVEGLRQMAERMHGFQLEAPK
jgi:iron complex transport system substrate-binding protein